MTKLEIEEGLKKLAEEKAEVAAHIQKAEREAKQAEARVEELNALLPGLLAGIDLKRISSSKGMKEFVRIKREKARQGRVIENYPFLKEGLRLEAKKLNSPNRGTHLIRNQDLWGRYDQLKTEIISSKPHDRHLDSKIARLKELSQHPDLNCVEDTLTFLKGLEKNGK